MIESPNFTVVNQKREISTIILHHTNMDSCKSATDRLCDPKMGVSCHYIIDKTDGVVRQLVADNNIAYHAGLSSWRGRVALNRYSIGIELDNNGLEDFSEVLMDSLLSLLHDLCSKHDIAGHNVIGHLDVAPTRKDDPHHKFDWKVLAKHGFGLYPRVQSNNFNRCMADPKADLEAFGYDCTNLRSAVIAFNTHFNPASFEYNKVEVWTESSNIYLKDLLEQLQALDDRFVQKI